MLARLTGRMRPAVTSFLHLGSPVQMHPVHLRYCDDNFRAQWNLAAVPHTLPDLNLQKHLHRSFQDQSASKDSIMNLISGNKLILSKSMEWSTAILELLFRSTTCEILKSKWQVGGHTTFRHLTCSRSHSTAQKSEFAVRGCSVKKYSPLHQNSKSIGHRKRNLSTNLDRWQFHENTFWGDQVLYLIIGINILVYVLWQNHNLRRFMSEHMTMSTDGIVREGKLHTLITSMFSHYSLGHLAANMITLWFFGGEIVALLGARRFLQLYIYGGLVSSLCQVAWPVIAPRLNIPGKYRNRPSQPGLGASGAVNAVVALSILAAPSRTVLLYFFVPIPSAALGCLFLGKDLAGLYYGDTAHGSAAHLGGAFWGAAFWFFLRRRPFHY